jgi:hypothetical protein
VRIPSPLSDEAIDRRLGEIAADASVGGCNSPLDVGIAPLVAGLIRWGVGTYWSCEGHRAPHLPYVSFEKTHVTRALYLAMEWSLQPEARYEWGATQQILYLRRRRHPPHARAFWFFDLEPLRPLGSGAIVDLNTAQADAMAFGNYLLSRRPNNYG